MFVGVVSNVIKFYSGDSKVFCVWSQHICNFSLKLFPCNILVTKVIKQFLNAKIDCSILTCINILCPWVDHIASQWSTRQKHPCDGCLFNTMSFPGKITDRIWNLIFQNIQITVTPTVQNNNVMDINSRSQHSLTFRHIFAYIDILKYSFSLVIILIFNNLPSQVSQLPLSVV